MNRRQIYNVVVYFVVLVAFVNVANAQSKDRDKPTPLTSNEISGVIDSDTKGHFYYYSFWANPGEIVITLTVQPGREVGQSSLGILTKVEFSLFDRNAEKLADKGVSTSEAAGAGQVVARIEVTRPQLMTLAVNIPGESFFNKNIGGKYRIQINGTIDTSQNAPSSGGKGGLTIEDIDGKDDEVLSKFNDFRKVLPKRRRIKRINIKMKDGTVRSIDLSQVDDIFLSN